MVFEISDHLLKNAKISSEELLLEIAVMLFQKERMTLAQASQLAGLHQMQFQKELGKRKIQIHYDIIDLERDLDTIKEMKL